MRRCATAHQACTRVASLRSCPYSVRARGALYVTVRVVPSNNVGRYVVAGKVPPLATARFGSPITFPFEVALLANDLTPEYAAIPREEWQLQDLTVSARWDVDGTAATRDPDDLVGSDCRCNESAGLGRAPARLPLCFPCTIYIMRAFAHGPGRGMVQKFESGDRSRWKPADVTLEGRGLTGRVLTGK